MDSRSDFYNKKLTEFEVDKANKDLAYSNQQRHDLANESRKILGDLYDKLLLYSAGAFSFGITVIGLVFENNKKSLTTIGFYLPNIYWLYISLFLYLLVCGLVLLGKKFDSYYVSSIGAYFWAKSLEKHAQANIDFLTNHPGQVLVTNSNPAQEISVHKGNKHKALESIPRLEKEYKLYLRLLESSHLLAEILVLVATSVTFLFFVQLLQASVWS